ncbi:MAG TPA: hypothetical protein PKI32_10040, partial [Opitutales bacterium]|nr:hypothetical protein [Opitutales bacterium]
KLDSIIDFAEIREFIDSPVQGYSSGMTVRLGVAIAAHCQPDILLLDEVLAVGDMGFQAKCFNTIAKFRESGTVFILVTHSMHYISRYCDKVLYLKHGAVEYFGDVERGVERFQNDMAVGSLNAQGEQPEWGRVCGTGKIAICAARFLNSKGEPTQKIASCDPVDLVVDYECRHAAPLPAVLDVLVRDFDGTFYQGSSNDFGVNLDAVTGKGSIVLHFKRLNSNSPVLSFFFTLMNPDTQEFYDWKRNLKLSIGVNPVVNGRVVLDVDWERVDR